MVQGAREMAFSIALRPNQVYPASDYLEHARHRVILYCFLPLGNRLKFSYLHAEDSDEISMADRAIGLERKEIDLDHIMQYVGAQFYRGLTVIHGFTQ
jgi:hypothetical protein